MIPASMEAIEKARAMVEKQNPGAQVKTEGTLDVRAYLAHYGHEVVKVRQNGTSTLFCLKECIFDPSHAPNEAHIGQGGDGKLYYRCFHNSCQDRTWAEAREKISAGDKLTPFLSLSNSPGIYILDNKDRKTIKEYQGSTEGGVSNPLNSGKTPFDPFSILKRGSDLMALDIQVTWVVDKILPEQSITLFHGRGGIGKTWLALILARAVSQGIAFMGLITVRLPVYFVDFENSLPVLVERVKKIEAEAVYFWHNTNEVRPPKLDSQEWQIYKALPPGLLIYDTLRASQTKDENDSRQMAEIMGRLKELRDLGFTILLLHHTPKGNEMTYKGSTAILDLADHVLSLHKVRKGSNEEIDDEESETPYYRFGTKGKTRYEPFHIFLEFDKERGFIVAPDPDTEEIEEIYDLLKAEAEPLKQFEVSALVKEKMGLTSKGKLVKLLRKGEGIYWETRRDEGKGRAIRYCPIVQQSIYEDRKTETENKASSPVLLSEEERTTPFQTPAQTVDTTALSYCPSEIRTERTETEEGVSIDDPDSTPWGY